MGSPLSDHLPLMKSIASTDESGDVDLSLIDYSLSHSLEERARQHYHARHFAERMRGIARERYGSMLDDLEVACMEVPPVPSPAEFRVES